MEQTSKRRIINQESASADAPINKNWVYVHKDVTLEVSPSEYELIMKFISFVRGRERGTFTASIMTHKQEGRQVILNFTDIDRIDLNPV